MFTPLNRIPTEIQAEKRLPLLLWQVDGVLAYDPETQCRLGYSRNAKGQLLKCWIDAPVMHPTSGMSLGYLKICSFKVNERALAAAIAKADQIFQKKYEKFVEEYSGLLGQTA
jgi:hypothetical protein